MLNAVIIYPVTNQKLKKESIDIKLDEIQSLALAININIVFIEAFNLRYPNPSTLIRKGKIEYFKNIINNISADTYTNLIIFTIDISPIQQRNLEKIFNKKILDKTSLILEIFGKRAVTKEGSLQVELAHLNWQKSRLVKSWTHLERQRGGFGFLGGPGESQIELDKRMINKRLKQIKSILFKIKKTRNIQFNNRKNSRDRMPIISLLGYTNAGKSTLFNRLTKLNVNAADKLFETLDTKVSIIYLAAGRKAFISDTVGFISDLPTLLVEAFKSTLEEIKQSDLLIHVRDCCATDSEQQKIDVLEVLKQLNIYPNSEEGPPMIEVMNKLDTAPKSLNENIKEINNLVFISAKTGIGIENLKENIKNILWKQN